MVICMNQKISTSDQNEFHVYRMKGERFTDKNMSKSKKMRGLTQEFGNGSKKMLKSVRLLNPSGKLYMIQDNSPIHKSKIVQNWIKSRKDIIVLIWTPLFPGLNYIEYLWAHMVGKLNPNNIKTKDTLIEIYIMNGIN